MAQAPIEYQRSAALFLVQVGVAGAHSQAVGFAHDGADDDLDGQMQVTHHPADDHRLLGVFLTEIGPVGLHDIEQLQYHRGHTTKMPGAAFALQGPAYALHTGVGLKLGRIDFLHGRSEQKINPLLLQQLGITGKVAGVVQVVLIRSELGGVDENGGDSNIVLTSSPANERQVTFVQRAHGRHKADALACRAQPESGFLHLCHSSQYLHPRPLR